MRIEAYNQVAQLYQTNNTKNVKQASAVAKMGRDQVQISSTGFDYQVAKKAVAEASDIREDLVAAKKAEIKSGNYSVDTEDFAAKLMAKLNSVF